MRFLLVVLLAASAVALIDQESKEEFRQFLKDHGKSYSSTVEHAKREAIFAKNRAARVLHNLKFKSGEVGWEQGINEFSDSTLEEFIHRLGYLDQGNTTEGAMSVEDAFPGKRYYGNVDWRARGKVGPVKNQANCGSCWAFATTSSTETCVAIAANITVPNLSEQQLQDCMFAHVCSPGGGGGAAGIDWVKTNGVAYGQEYPYIKANGKCHYTTKRARITGRVHGNTEDQLATMLQKGAVLIGVNADLLMGYKSGVINDANHSKSRNHAVTVVAITNQCNGVSQQCWVIKNQWGTGWGEKGYFRVAKGKRVIGLGDDSDMPTGCRAHPTICTFCVDLMREASHLMQLRTKRNGAVEKSHAPIVKHGTCYEEEKDGRSDRSNFSRLSTEQIAQLTGETGRMMIEYPWHETSIGPRDTWPVAYHSAIDSMLTSQWASSLMLGSDLLVVYNDHYRSVMGQKHPQKYAHPAEHVWQEIWPTIGPMLKGVMTDGKPNLSEDVMLPLNSGDGGSTKERYLSWCFSPLLNGNEITAVLITVYETTSYVFNHGDTHVLKELSQLQQKTRNDAINNSMQIMSQYSCIPFNLFYCINRSGDHLVLTGNYTSSIGKSLCHRKISLGDPKWSLTNAVREVFKTSQMKILDLNEGDQPITAEPHSRRIQQVLILPMGKLGVIMIGINPWRELDHHYSVFLQSIGSQITTVLVQIKNREEEAKRVKAMAELDREKTAFFSNMSHEFRTPLTLMLGPLDDLLQLDRNTPILHVEDSLQLIRRNSGRLLKLVNNLLNFTRIETGRMQLNMQPTNLCGAVMDFVSIFRSACEKSGLELIVNKSEREEIIAADINIWETIVYNLMSNALKYTMSGSITVNIQQDDREFTFGVTDTGVGISQEDQKKVFERFYRVAHAAGRSHEGSGIGLSLVRELVELHKGKASLTSLPGRGSTFSVTIPCTLSPHAPSPLLSHADNQHADIDLMLPSDSSSSKGDHSSQAHSSRGDDISNDILPRILVVDDNSDMRGYLCKLLTGIGRMETARNGQEALDACKPGTIQPDLILSDVMMPIVDGLELLQRLRANVHTENIPIILITARTGEDSRHLGLGLGADDYMLKPFSALDLKARVISKLKLNEMRKESNRRELLRLQAEKVNHSKDLFIASLSHEMRTPLAPILLMIQDILLDHTLSTTNRDTLNLMNKNIKTEIQLIDDLLDVTKTTKDKMVLHTQMADGRELMDHTISNLRIDFTEKNQEVTFACTHDRVDIEADSVRLQQIYWNLLRNAIKFSPEHGKIQVTMTTEGDQMIVTVTDHGIGIDQETTDKIFRPFEQGEGINQKFGGLGLGLSLCKSLALMHHGDLTVSSKGRGFGSTFSLSLPLTQPKPAHDHHHDHHDHHHGIDHHVHHLHRDEDENGVEEERDFDPKEWRVLLVEDDKTTLMVMRRVLSKLMGFNILKTADSCKAAREMAHNYDFNLLISDIGLPDGTGYDVITQLKGDCGQAFKAIALSGYGMSEDIEKSRSHGFDLHLTKPIDLNLLKEVMRKMRPPKKEGENL
ncbi:response regulator receiver ATP-binding protein [Planoprotostelium fungivorum]|uniref:histidine kinase n=1 Tax=Planoprotostelium fungivorum TaxID=1890364 RepID=A0A2P6NWA1_9EUKA|nr:response regulator receiver ATP-binding protein [Planoprotostelium fungivorum]